MSCDNRTIELVEGSNELCTFDFSLLLATGETVTGVTSVTLLETPTGATAVTIGTPAYSSDSAQARITCPDGSGGYVFPLTVIVTTSDSNTKVEDWYLRVVNPKTVAEINP